MTEEITKTTTVDRLLTMTGLILVFFIVSHLLFVSTILLGKEAMYEVTQFFELSFMVKDGMPSAVSLAVLMITGVIIVHVIFGIKKFFGDYKEYMAVKHTELEIDPPSWSLQLFSGLVIIAALSVHLFIMFTEPDNIGPFASADRIVSGYMWVVYLVLLICVEIHGSIGLYRIAIKWHWVEKLHLKVQESDMLNFRKRIGTAFLILGFMTLGMYMKIGFEHWGETERRYHPTTLVGK